MSRAYRYFAALIGLICVGSFVYVVLFSHARTVRGDILQGILLGFGFSFAAAQIVAWFKTTRVNGWTTMFGLGNSGNGMLMRAAGAQVFPGPVNSEKEAMYWWTTSDATGRVLDGRDQYILHFPPGGLPPNRAFWSLTMGDARNHFVPNPLNRYSVSDRTGLVPNADGSIDVHIQKEAPDAGESNWLPAPSGRFILWLRVYLPEEAILDGTYRVPPVLKVGVRAA